LGIKRKLTKIPAVQWEIGQVKTGQKGTGEITNKKRNKSKLDENGREK